MESLPVFLKLAGRAVILVGSGPAADAKARLLQRAGARIVGGDDREARIAVVAEEDEGVAARVVARLRVRGLLVNAVDRPHLSDFTFPAIIDRAPVTIAVGTAGYSAGLAKTLRIGLEALLPAALGGLAKALASARPAVQARWPEPDTRRRAIDRALGHGGPLDPFTLGDGHADGAERVAAWLEDGDADGEPSRLAEVRLASSDPDDLTLRAARLLSRADRVYHRPGVPSDILDRARADAERIECDASPSTPSPGLSVDLGFR